VFLSLEQEVWLSWATMEFLDLMVTDVMTLEDKVLLVEVEVDKGDCNGLSTEDLQSFANNPLPRALLGKIVFKVTKP
jgi:hypothetical protein